MTRVKIHAPNLSVWQDRDCHTHVSFQPKSFSDEIGRHSITCSVTVDGVNLDWSGEEAYQYLRFATAIGENATLENEQRFHSKEHGCPYGSIELVFPSGFLCYRAGHKGLFFSGGRFSVAKD